MGILFIDGADHYGNDKSRINTGSILRKWGFVTIGALPGVALSGGREGGGAIHVSLASSFALAQKLVGPPGPDSRALVVGAAIKVASLPASGTTFVLLSMRNNADEPQMELRLNADGTLELFRDTTSVTSGQSTLSFTSATYQYVEWACRIANSIASGQCQVRVNGSVFIDLPSGTSTQAGGAAGGNVFALGNTRALGIGVIDYDDVYVLDASGALSTFLNDVRVRTLFPVAPGGIQRIAAVKGASGHASAINERDPDMGGTYIYHPVGFLGSASDSYQFTSLLSGTAQSVYAVQVGWLAGERAGPPAVFAEGDTVVYGQVKISMVTWAAGQAAIAGTQTFTAQTYGDPPTFTQNYSLVLFESHPVLGGAWTLSSVNATEWGINNSPA